MQSSHSYKATAVTPAHNQAAVAHHGPADVAALGFATVLLFGIPLFAAFVVYRAFRWFFRATR